MIGAASLSENPGGKARKKERRSPDRLESAAECSNTPNRSSAFQSRRHTLGDQLFDGGGKVAAKFFQQSAAMHFRKLQRLGGGVNKTARGLITVTQQTPAPRQRVERKR